MSHDEMHKDLQKIERELTKVGLREGIADGRETNFQSGFDKGYSNGFRNAFEIGKLQAKLSFEHKQSHPLLENPKVGWCQLCKTENFSQTISQAVTEQTKIHQQNVKTLSKSIPQ